MCGRYTQIAKLELLGERFRFTVGTLELKPRYNIAPTQDAPVVVNDGGRQLRLHRWGLIPHWAKDAAIGNRMINARAETLLEKPSFKKPFETKRCLVLADGYYEWRKDPGAKLKTPMRVVLKGREPFAMAGLWESWGEIKSFTIITTSADETLKPIHDRMPVILRAEDEERWLDCAVKAQDLTGLLTGSPDDRIEAYEVSRAVNVPINDSPQCIEPVKR